MRITWNIYLFIYSIDGSLVKLEEIWECIPKVYSEGNLPNDVDVEQTRETILYRQFGSFLTQMVT